MSSYRLCTPTSYYGAMPSRAGAWATLLAQPVGETVSKLDLPTAQKFSKRLAAKNRALGLGDASVLSLSYE